MASVDPVAQAAFELYSRDVYAWAYRFLGRHHDALDVVQDVYVKWDEQCAKTKPDRPRSWLRRVTLNRVIDQTRRAARTAAQHAAGTQAEGPVRDSAAAARTTLWPALGTQEPEDGLDRDDLRRDITSALADLTDAQRLVLVAKVYEDMTFQRIAEELDLAVSTVKTHYVRAVGAVGNRLRRRWGHVGDA